MIVFAECFPLLGHLLFGNRRERDSLPDGDGLDVGLRVELGEVEDAEGVLGETGFFGAED